MVLFHAACGSGSEAAASKIQAIYRGRAARDQAKLVKHRNICSLTLPVRDDIYGLSVIFFLGGGVS